jgi:hypothetical protein
LGASSSQKFPFGQPTSTSVLGSGSNATAASKPDETSAAPKPKGAQTETPKFSFGPLYGSLGHRALQMLHRHPSQILSFGALSGISTFATAPSSGGDAKKTDASLSIFGAVNAVKED